MITYTNTPNKTTKSRKPVNPVTAEKNRRMRKRRKMRKKVLGKIFVAAMVTACIGAFTILGIFATIGMGVTFSKEPDELTAKIQKHIVRFIHGDKIAKQSEGIEGLSTYLNNQTRTLVKTIYVPASDETILSAIEKNNGVYYLEDQGYVIETYQADEKPVKENIDDIYEYAINNKIFTDGTPSKLGISNTIAEMYNIPENVLRSFIDFGGYIVVADDATLMGRYGNSTTDAAHPAGFNYSVSHLDQVNNVSIADSSIIYLNDTEDNARYALLHEIGHFVDLRYAGGLSATEDWQNIWLVEASSSGLDKYFTTDPREFFAEMFKWSLQDRESAYAACPKAVEYVTYYAGLL